MTEITPAARQAAATRAMSRQRSVGLIGDSNQTMRVSGPMSARRGAELVEGREPGA